MKHPPTCAFGVLLLSLAYETAAQPASRTSLTPGQRVRVTASVPGSFSGSVTGTLVKSDSQSISLIDGANKSLTELPLSAITRVEIGHKRRHTTRGLLIGAGIGALLGIAIQGDTSASCFDTVGNVTISRPCTDSEKRAIGATLFGVSAAAGALLGHRKQSDVWVDTPLDRMKVSVRPTRDGGRLALAFSF